VSELKPISREGVPAALKKAERYRLINDPSSAESICLDILRVDPGNEAALVALILSITDQLPEELNRGVQRARELLPTLPDEYKRAYYGGIVAERRAKAQRTLGGPGSASVAAEWFREAMKLYEEAERLRPAGNDESILRWNTCLRLLERMGQPEEAEREEYHPALE
jgi:hypothetical protein